MAISASNSLRCGNPMTNLPFDHKARARDRLNGIWATVPTPFTQSFAIDEAGLRKNLHHWLVDLRLAGLFVCGKQGEFFSMSVAERKRVCDIAVAAAREYRPSGGIMMSCSDQNLDTVIELARHADAAMYADKARGRRSPVEV